MVSYNPAIHELGVLCCHGHDFTGDGRSLRHKKKKICIICKRDQEMARARKRREEKDPELFKKRQLARHGLPGDELLEFDRSKFRLGILCPLGHEFEDTGRSLRYLGKSGGQCKECHRLMMKSDRRVEWRRSNYKKNIERFREKGRKYYWKDVEKSRERNKKFRSSPKGKECLSRGSHKRRCAEKSIVNIHISAKEIQEHFAKFNNLCVYCGKAGGSVDHFIPVSKGGSHVLSNLVCACIRCNVSKSNRDPKEWFQKQKFYSKKRWKLILQALGKSEKTVNQIPLL